MAEGDGSLKKLLTIKDLYTIINKIDKSVDGESKHHAKFPASRR